MRAISSNIPTLVAVGLTLACLLLGAMFALPLWLGESKGTARAQTPAATSSNGALLLCNRTPSLVGVAVGYKSEDRWTTEGWWNVPANSCETLLPGKLVSRFYYIYAVDYDRGGEWSGRAIMCTEDKQFTIQGTEDCVARGYRRTGFFEVDTGNRETWTVQLNDDAPNGSGGR